MESGTSSSPRNTRTLRCHDYDISRDFPRAVAKRRWLVELHGEAVVFRQVVRNTTEHHLDTPLLHPDLLMNTHVARAGFISHACAGRQNDLDDLNGRGKVGRRNIAPYVAGLRIAPRRPIIAPGHRVDSCSRIVK